MACVPRAIRSYRRKLNLAQTRYKAFRCLLQPSLYWSSAVRATFYALGSPIWKNSSNKKSFPGLKFHLLGGEHWERSSWAFPSRLAVVMLPCQRIVMQRGTHKWQYALHFSHFFKHPPSYQFFIGCMQDRTLKCILSTCYTIYHKVKWPFAIEWKVKREVMPIPPTFCF